MRGVVALVIAVLWLGGAQGQTVSDPRVGAEWQAEWQAGLAAEARAIEIAEGLAPIETYVEGIYEGPALMASYRGQTDALGEYQGYGVLTLPDSPLIMAGLFSGGLLNGPGVERDIDGTLLHSGLYVDAVRAEWLDPVPVE